MIFLAAISFLTPLMFLGLSLAALPIAAHLLNRRARRRIVFPTILLLSESSASQSQFFKLRRLLLLLLRCLAVLLVVLAFAQPIWRRGAKASAQDGGDGGAAVALVIDMSASAGQRSGGVAALQSLRAAAVRTLDAMARGRDVANVIFAAAKPHAALPSMSRNLDAVQQAIESAKLTHERADLPAAVAMAGQMLAEHQGPRHLVVLSDLQASNWRDVQARLTAGKPLAEGTMIRIVSPTGPPPGNLGLSDASMYPPMPVVGQPVQLTVKLSNHSGEHQTVRLAMMVGETSAPTESQTVALAPRQQRELAFAHRFDRPGEHEVRFELPSDALEADNLVYLAAHVVQRIKVIVVGDDDPDEPGTSTYFTTRALAPRGSEADRYDVRQVASSALTPVSLQNAAAVLVSYTRLLSPAALHALHGYMAGGGGMVLFCGDGPVDRNLRALDKLDPAGLAPWAPGRRRDLASRGELLSIVDGDWRSPLLRDFDQASQHAISQIRFGRVWSADAVRPDARVLLKYSDGSAAMASHPVGDGTLIVANFSPAWGSSDLAKYGSFVALMHSLVAELQPKRAVGDKAHVGQTLTMTADILDENIGATVSVVGPDVRPINDVNVSGGDNSMTVTVFHPTLPGFYAALQGDQVLSVAAVNVDSRESDLRRIDPQVLQQQLSSQGVNVAVHDTDGVGAAVQTQGDPMWGAMLAAALTVIGLELALLGYWQR